MKKCAITLLAVLLTTCGMAIATPQVRDVLYWHGEKYYVYPYIEAERYLDDSQRKILLAQTREPFSTANGRGYQLVFEINNDSLYLASILKDNQEDLTTLVLGSHGRIMLDRLTDTLYLGYGKSFYEEQFPTMVYENEMTVAVKDGVVQWSKDHRNKSRGSDFPLNTLKLHKLICSTIRWDDLDERLLEGKPQALVGFSTDSTGKVESVSLLESSGCQDLDDEALRTVSCFPNFSSSFVCGHYLNHSYRLPIRFDRDKCLSIMDIGSSKLQQDNPKKQRIICLKGVLKDYFDCNLEYPKTIDELLYFYSNCSTNNGYDESFVRFIQQEKEQLRFRSSWINAWKEELAVIFEGDTIINLTDERDYFDLFLLASSYYGYNDDYPVSMDELVIYDSLSKADYRNDHNKAMISFLSKHKQEIKLISSDYDMLIMMEKDTILYYPGGDVKARCYSSSPQYKLVYRFFDHQNHYAYTEELEKYFRYGIRVLALDFAPYEGDYSDVHLLVYTKENGLQPYCEDDDVRLDSDWFVVLEKYLKGFVCQYNLGRVVFGVLELHR